MPAHPTTPDRGDTGVTYSCKLCSFSVLVPYDMRDPDIIIDPGPAGYRHIAGKIHFISSSQDIPYQDDAVCYGPT